MPFRTPTFNKHGLVLRWPRVWIILLGLILIFLCLAIAGMEVGHTIFDVYRSTAFGGFIVFFPLLICAIFVLITACKTRLCLLRLTVLLCCIMILLCAALIAYDILVLIDPTRCFFLNCNYANVNISNSTTNVVVTGWPLYISWPSYFQTNMNAKRIFQSIQILLAGLYVLFSCLYMLTYYIYRHIRLHQKTAYNSERRRNSTYDTNPNAPVKYATNPSHSYPSYQSHPKITTYTIESSPNISYQSQNVSSNGTLNRSSKKAKSKTFVRPRANSVDYNRLCTRCNREPRMILVSNYERQNYFPHLCINCNNELINDRRRAALNQTRANRAWLP